MTTHPILWAILLTLGFAATSHAQPVYLEQGGLIVIEPESIENLPEGWVRGPGPELTAPNVNDPDDATGNGFITWQGNQFLNQPGNAEILVGLLISNAGTYRFQWRNQVGSGTSPTDHNDTWVKIEANSFYGQSGSSIVCPKGYDPELNDCIGDEPNGSGSGGWFKVYSSGATNWRFSTRTSDHDAHDIFARFDRAGLYFLLLSARSSFHILDRLVLHREDYDGNPQDLALPPSPEISAEPIFSNGFE